MNTDQPEQLSAVMTPPSAKVPDQMELESNLMDDPHETVSDVAQPADSAENSSSKRKKRPIALKQASDP